MRTDGRLLIFLVILILLVSIAPIASSQVPVSDTNPTTLKVETREVVLDVVVTDKAGNFVNGLKKEDFTVLEDKVPQTLTSFQPPSMHSMPPNAPEVESSADLAKIGDAPVTILVLDELDTKFEDMAFSRGAMEKWLNRQPAKLQQPAILLVASDERFDVLHDYTQDRDALLATLKKHFPSYPYRLSKGGSKGPDAGSRMALNLGSLMEIAQASSGTPGRKNVIWVGVGFPSLTLNDVTNAKQDEIVNVVARATATMLKARVTLNIVDPTAMATSSLDIADNPDYLTIDQIQTVEGPTSGTVAGILNFDTFAPATGGSFFYGRNDVDREIETAVNNGSNYYTLFYSPTNGSKNPAQFRNIRITMRDPSLTATTRTGYFPAIARKPGEAPHGPTTAQLGFDLTSAALNSISYNGLKAEIHTAATGYLLDVRSSDLQPHILSNGDYIGEVTVMQVCFGAKNKVLQHAAFDVRTNIPSDSPPEANVEFTVPAARPPTGTRRMRFVARDALSGHIGTVDILNP